MAKRRRNVEMAKNGVIEIISENGGAALSVGAAIG
jgi:hypothetical protein